MARPHADINVTPLIDVLLVLLVIFLAALPLTQKSLDTSLPRPAATPAVPRGGTIMLEYSADGRIAVNRQETRPADLETRLRTIYANRTDKTMYIAGAGTLRYRQIIEVIDAARGAGVDRVGIVTESMRVGSRPAANRE